MKPILMFEQFLQEVAASTSGPGGAPQTATKGPGPAQANPARPSNRSAPQTARKGQGPKTSPATNISTPTATTVSGRASYGLAGSIMPDDVKIPAGPTVADDQITKLKDMLVDMLDGYVTIEVMQTIAKTVKALKDKKVESKQQPGRTVSALGRLCLMYADDERGDLLSNDIKGVGETTWNVGEGGKEAKAEALAVLSAPAQGLKGQVNLGTASFDQLKAEFFI